MSPTISAKIERETPSGRKSDYGLELADDFRELVDGVVKDMKAAAPVKTGRLRREIRVTKERGKMVAEITFGAPYTYYVNEKRVTARGKRYPHFHFIDKTLERKIPERLNKSNLKTTRE